MLFRMHGLDVKHADVAEISAGSQEHAATIFLAARGQLFTITKLAINRVEHTMLQF